MKDYLAQSVEDFERHRIRSARNNALFSLGLLALWVTTAVVIAQRDAEPWSWVAMSLFLFGVVTRLMFTIKDWINVKRNPHAPPTN